MKHEELADWCATYARDAIGPQLWDQHTDEFSAVANDAAARILGAGKKYEISENEQGFERSTVGTMLVGLREELLDVINYAAMISVLVDAELGAEWYRIESGEVPSPVDDADTPLREALFSIQGDIRGKALSAAVSIVMLDRRLAELVALGHHTPRDGSYEEQLAAEIAATPTCPDCGEVVCELAPEEVPHAARAA